ncbi:Hypothetical predicted protein [Octopus vulgaris]|uniref:Uncharacterized protein n=1 Tax=Octopus vulgaris TaxID=6645 RepID=A0AA36FLU7_OCTVU|nr:Hypothetical predicted protein [Octopus vulgaris]
MKGIGCFVIVMCLLALGVAQHKRWPEDDCHLIRCFVNECHVTKCRNFPDAECRARCACFARFFWRGHDVTPLCNLPFKYMYYRGK